MNNALSYPTPITCTFGMCNSPSAIVLVEVQKPSGRNVVKTFGEVCVKNGSGNITNSLSSDYVFVRWHAWCADCYMIEVNKKKEVEEIDYEEF